MTMASAAARADSRSSATTRAMGSPPWRTMSPLSSGRGGFFGDARDGDAGVGHGRAHDDGAQRSRRRVVVGKATSAGDERLVFHAAHAGAHAEFRGSGVIHGMRSAAGPPPMRGRESRD